MTDTTTTTTTPTTTSLDPGAAPVPARPPRRRRLGVGGHLWRLFAAVLALGTLGWTTINVVSLLAHEERVETEAFPAADVGALLVDTDAGDVRIVAAGAETDEITVRAEISEGLRDTGSSRRIVDGVLELRGSCPIVLGGEWCRVHYDVEVPADVPVRVLADNGHVEVTATTASVTVNGGSGSVTLADLAGPVDASTDDGSVRGTGLTSRAVRAESDDGSVHLEHAAAPTTVDASTDDGSVEVVVPDDGATYRVDLRTGDGREELDVPTDPNADRSLTLSTGHGTVTARTSG